MKVIISPDAINDLEEIWDYISKDNLSAANKVELLLREKILSL